MLEAPPPTGEIVVNLVADFVCPWCFIGATRLDQAVAALSEKGEKSSVKVVHQPFLLDPSTPPEGRDLREHLAAKYGGDPEAMFARVEGVARESGIALDFTKVRRSVSTQKAHTLVQHALELGTQPAFVKALYEAYFLEGKDIGDDEVLLSIAERHGLPRDEAKRLLASPDELDETLAEARAAKDQGISGVPFFVFDGRFAVSGAQGVPVLVEALTRSLTPAG